MTVENYLKKLRCVKNEDMLEKLIARIADTLAPGSQATFQKAADRRRAELCEYQFRMSDDYGVAKSARRY